jgi:hypothetical protein
MDQGVCIEDSKIRLLGGFRNQKVNTVYSIVYINHFFS